VGNPFKKVQPGQKLEIPAEAFNTFIDAALDFKARQRSQQQSSIPAIPAAQLSNPQPNGGGPRAV